MVLGQTSTRIDLPQVDPTLFMPMKNEVKSIKSPLKTSKNELDLMFNVLFNGYKSYLSSQDINSCTFYPSCSEYGLQAIQKKGLIMGMAKTFDRLSRCHGLSPELYEINPKDRMQIDRP